MLDRVPNLLYRGLVTLLGLVVILALIPGCGALDTMLQKDGNAKSVLGEWIGNTSKSSSPQGQNPTGESKTIVLYFADSTGKYLIAEERTIPKTLSLARETVTQWLRGPAVKGTSVQSAASPSTTLLDIAVKDGIATVDLSKDFSQPYAKVSPEVTLYGLVNSLTQFPTIKEVKFRVEGKPLQKLGAVDAGNLTYKGGLIKSGSPTTAQPKSPSTSDTTGTTTGGNPAPASPSSINLFSFPVSTT